MPFRLLNQDGHSRVNGLQHVVRKLLVVQSLTDLREHTRNDVSDVVLRVAELDQIINQRLRRILDVRLATAGPGSAQVIQGDGVVEDVLVLRDAEVQQVNQVRREKPLLGAVDR